MHDSQIPDWYFTKLVKPRIFRINVHLCWPQTYRISQYYKQKNLIVFEINSCTFLSCWRNLVLCSNEKNIRINLCFTEKPWVTFKCSDITKPYWRKNKYYYLLKALSMGHVWDLVRFQDLKKNFRTPASSIYQCSSNAPEVLVQCRSKWEKFWTFGHP